MSLEVGAGSVVAVLGSNGAGKTSLLRAISRALGAYGGAVTGGTIRYEGVDLAGLDASAVVRRGLVQVPEGRRVFRDLTVEENLRAGGYTVRDTKTAQRGPRPGLRPVPRPGRAARTSRAGCCPVASSRCWRWAGR